MTTDSHGSVHVSDGLSTVLTVLEPSSAPESAVLESNLAVLRQAGIQVRYQRYPLEAGDRQAQVGVNARAQILSGVLSDPEIAYVLAARGGYGASDLLRRSEERRVGKGCRSRWSPDHLKQKPHNVDR